MLNLLAPPPPFFTSCVMVAFLWKSILNSLLPWSQPVYMS